MSNAFNYTFDADLLPMTEMVKAIVTDGLAHGEVRYEQVYCARDAFDREGPYCLGKRLGLLKPDYDGKPSAEDMAIEFMTYINQIWPCTY